MLPREFAVVTRTSDGQEVSLFAPQEFVRPDQGLLRVTVLERRSDRTMVYLPASPFEVPSRTVTVSSGELIE
jgi:hypothetical protein